jgi:hypothetical protein
VHHQITEHLIFAVGPAGRLEAARWSDRNAVTAASISSPEVQVVHLDPRNEIDLKPHLTTDWAGAVYLMVTSFVAFLWGAASGIL